MIWTIYPKAHFKAAAVRVRSHSCWYSLGSAAYEPVGQVAIDEDRSALRFRKAEFLRVMRRTPEDAISIAGRKKTSSQRTTHAIIQAEQRPQG